MLHNHDDPEYDKIYEELEESDVEENDHVSEHEDIDDEIYAENIEVIGPPQTRANYSRHLEEIAKEAERQTLASVQNLLMEEKVNKAVQLLEYWEEYLVISDTITQTMEEEMQLFLRRITKLESLLKELYMKCTSTDEGNTILQLLNKCSKIFEAVSNEKSLSAGGRFEWVNSVLVKCLQEGSWLLVDNVNLCSAAVLDRLNALLEPNGVLTISEKGVDESGNMFEVRPHQDFRIFLTMDPKNGEISRAMKNRGVEIYMLNETETVHSNQFDLKSLIDMKGLSNPKHINGLIRIHEFISDLILSEKPRNMEILQCSSLISQQIYHGINVLDAFYNTCIEVYYKTRNSSEFNCNNVLEVIKDGIHRCLSESSVNEDFYCKDATLSTRDLARWSDFEKVKHQSAIYKKAIIKFNDNVKAAKRTMSSDSVEKIETEYKGGTSRTDKSRRLNDVTIWLDLKLVKQQNDFFESINFYTLVNLLAINYSMSSNYDLELRTLFLKSVISQQEWQGALERFNTVVKFFDRKDSTLPLDCRWVIETPRKVTDNLICNAINYALQVEIHNLKDVLEIKYSSKNSLYNYILALKKKSVSDIFNSPICLNYLTIRSEHFVFMKQIIINFAKKPKSEDCFIKILILLSWRQALHSFLTSVRLPDDRLKSPRLITSKLEALAIYYKWFYKHSVEAVAKLLDIKVPPTLKKNLAAINRQTEEQFSSSYKIAKNYKKFNSVPEPFKNEWQLTAIDFLNKYDLLDLKIDEKKMLAIFKNNPELRKVLIKLKYETYSDSDSNGEISLLKAFDENKTDEKSLKLHELQVLPLVDILTQMMLLYTIKSINSGSNFDLDSINNNILVPVELHGVLLKYKETGDNTLLHEIRKWFYSFSMNSASANINKFVNARKDSGLCLLIAGVGPIFVNIMTQLLVSSGKNPTTLSNFRDVQNQQRTLGLLLWSNIHALSDIKFDFVSLQVIIVENNIKTFMCCLQNALNITLCNLEDLEYDPQDLNDIGDEKLVRCVKEILKKYTDLKNIIYHVTNKDASLSYIGDLHMLLGFAEVYLNSLLPQVDPLAKKAMKINHIVSVITMFEQMKKSFELQNSLYSNVEECPHPYYQAIKNTIFALQDKIRTFGKSTTVDLNTYSYSYVVQQIKHAFNSALNTTILLDISDCTEKLNNLNTDLSADVNSDMAKIKSYIERFESNIPSFERIFHDWKLYRSSYPDIVEPLLANISQFLYGLKLKLFWIKREFLKWQHRTQFNVDLESELINLAALPTLNENVDSLDKHVDKYTENNLRRFIDCILGDEHKAKENLRLLKCGMQELYNQCIVNAKNTGVLDRNLLEMFNNLVEVFIDSWNIQQEKREQEKSDAESLYKSRTKCDDISEEEQQQNELKELFPNYHVLDFSDFQETSLSDSPAQITKHENSIDVITDEDLRFVIDLNTNLFKNFIKTEWLAPEFSKNVLPDFVSPVMEKFKLVRLVMDNHAHYFKYTMDSKLSASLAVLLEVSRRYGAVHELGEASSPTRIINKKTKDFYKNSDVEEVKSCYHVLEELKIKVNELLQEWPDQPTLNTILTVIDRILNFDITSPVSRFLTGFDILLAKCHEWEEVAHHGVSLIHITPNLTNQILTWRKLELSGWKDLLNSTFEKLKKHLTKWWLYMYNLMNQYIREKKVTEAELIDILQKFVTKSTLVEFHGRLEIILEFHCHAVTLCNTPECQSFINILWNIYNYFQQFSLSVSNKIKDLRTPIEKKLKDYVKIVKWKDVSYWSIKNTVDKSHKTLHKFVREYKEVLLQPVTPYLINPVNDNPVESVGIWDRPQRQNPKAYHYTLDADSYIVKASTKDLPYLSKARKICKETILGTDYPVLVKSLDSFVTDVVETSSHLRNLEVDTTLTKEKQKSQAKNILHQKHRALADLFQNLSKMGVSYKTGIIESKLKKHTDEYTIKPIDLAVSLNYLGHNRMDEKILTIWDSCESYYYRCLMRLDVLETALLTPAQDLGMQNIERCRGFAAHLLTFCHEQKKDLVEATRSHYYLRSYVRQMREASENSSFVSSTTFSKIKNILNSLTVSICQIKLFLNSCPEEQTFDNQLTDITLLEPNSKKLKYKHDENWMKAMEYVTDITCLTAKINLTLQKSEIHTPCAQNDLITVSFVPFNNKEQLFLDLQKMIKALNNLIVIFDPIKISECLNNLAHRLEQIIEDYTTGEPYSTSDFDLLLDQFRKAMLLVFQNLYIKYRDANVAKQYEKPEEDEDIGIQESHLKTLVMRNLSSDVAALELKKLLNLAERVVGELIGKSSYPSEDVRNSTLQCLPIFEQVIQLSQYFVTQQVAAYHITCKLTSILLNIFIDLVSKGFCIPPELSDEIDKEGISKPSDGMGLGEGQGERDVSDKIESEDQLDDAQPAGQEKETTEDPDCKEEEKGIEMSEDFDSKLQDKKPADDEDEEQSDNSEAEEQMGETEKGVDQLDQEIWGDDKEEGNEEEDDSEKKEEEGQGGEKEGEDQLGAKEENASKDKSKDKDPPEGQGEDSEKNKKEINEMKEPEFDDEQTDPFHGNQPELPEPEAMDLPDDLQLDEGEEKDTEQPEENPFDIDDMKEQQIPEDKPDIGDQTNKENQNDEEKDFSSDDEDITKKDEDDMENDSAEPNEDKTSEQEKIEEPKESQEGEEGDENAVDHEESALDQNPTNQENVEAMEIDEATATDKTQASQSENLKSDVPIEETCQEDKPDKDGLGQSQMEQSESGHSIQSSAPQEAKSSNLQLEKEQKRKERPGESDSKRSLGDVSQEITKKLKTMEAKDTERPDQEGPKDQTEDVFQHIKEATEKTTAQVLDAATKEQAEEQNKETTHKDDEDEDIEAEGSKDLPEDKDEQMDVDVGDTENKTSVKNENSKGKTKNKKQHPEGDIMEEIQDVEIEGEIVKTSTVPRGGESFHHTQYQLLQDTSSVTLTQEEIHMVRSEVEKQLSSWKSAPSSVEAELAWQKISSVTSSLAQDLSEQLRLVLEPTQASHLKGDFRTGRRINMRKVIPYIASQFRKDKIWLRRTKPSKREYQIVLAIDDSSSMADNHSKELAFESVALISKALSLLESGQLAVVSFGETTEVHHKLTDPFTDQSGVQLLQNFQFDQQKTCIGKLVDFVTEMFDQSNIHTSIPNATLLLIVSDGRGVFSEGKTYVTQAVRRAKLANIFVVFVIIDSPENKNSILDIRSTIFKDGKFLGMQSYMDEFPFSFYIILRDINSLPGVLSDALMQWFEMVTSQQ